MNYRSRRITFQFEEDLFNINAEGFTMKFCGKWIFNRLNLSSKIWLLNISI